VTFAAWLRSLSAQQIGIHLPPCPERDAIIDACRDAGKTIVGIASAPDVIVTADGVYEGGVVRPLKEEVDAALPDARTVIVLRLAGNAPLAPTLDAYLDVEMREGRDIWLDEFSDQVGASG
jgi:hypothetical protein